VRRATLDVVPVQAIAAVRRALLVTLLVALGGTLLAWGLRGTSGAVGAGVGSAIVLASNAVTLVVLIRTKDSPVHVLQVAVLGTTVGKLMALMILVVTLANVDALDGPSFGVAVLVGTVVFVVLDAVLVTKAKIPIIDDPAVPAGDGPAVTCTVPPR
jgi:F0F1-type ATP synthase assembly protein I